MANQHTGFWLELLQMEDHERRAHLWNGYLAWKHPILVDANSDAGDPPGAWPVLDDQDRALLDEIARRHGGHPALDVGYYMDFKGRNFMTDVDFSGLCLVWAWFDSATFQGGVTMSETTKVLRHASFAEAHFRQNCFCNKTYFEQGAHFAGARFERFAMFTDVEFGGGACFSGSVFNLDARFDDSRFREIGLPKNIASPSLADFSKAVFHGRASFRRVTFGDATSPHGKRLWPERRAEFSDATFKAVTDFGRAVFNGVPAFFNATLHEDTDFTGVDWRRAKAKKRDVDYAIRAWERLELIMSQLEKSVDRHRFYRLKMRVRRRVDGPFLGALNWLFDAVCEYGWGLGRSLAWWLAHWALSGVVLFVNGGGAARSPDWPTLALAAAGTAFSNAHAFLGLTRAGGYLEPGRKLLEQHDRLGLLVPAGVVEAFLGPVFLFLVALAFRNRFRLA